MSCTPRWLCVYCDYCYFRDFCDYLLSPYGTVRLLRLLISAIIYSAKSVGARAIIAIID